MGAPADSPFLTPAARAGVYRLLARLWVRELDEEFARTLSAEPLHQVFTQAGGSLDGHSNSLDEWLQPWAVDFCQLFLGPNDHLPPLQSVWQHGQLEAAPTSDMREFMAAANYQLSEDEFQVPADHLGVQFDVMGQLQQMIADTSAEDSSRPTLQEMERHFFFAHLAWSADLVDAVCLRAQTALYRSVGQMTGQFLRFENTRLAEAK